MKSLLPIAVCMLMVSVGMSLSPRQLVDNWRRLTHSLWVRLLVATFLVPPLLALALGKVLPLAGPYATLGLTPEWAASMVPHGEVLKHGGSLSFHSDMPMAPAKPLQLIWAGVNRFTYEGKVAGPQHKVPLDVALKAMTIDAAFSIQLEKEVGSIEVGKNANLTVLDKSRHEVAPEKLREIAVWGTMLEGRVQPVKATGKKTAQATVPTNFEPILDAAMLPPRSFTRRFNPTLCANGCACSFGQALTAAMVATTK